MQTLPNRASDAGPDIAQEPEPDWKDLLFFASDEMLDCIRLNDDDVHREWKLRQDAIHCAIEHLQAALAALPRPRTASDHSVS